MNDRDEPDLQPDPIVFRDLHIADPEFKLTTNIGNSYVCEVCERLMKEGLITVADGPPGLCIRLHWFEFLDGACLVVATHGSVTVTYRTFEQWERLEARAHQEEVERKKAEVRRSQMRASYRKLIDRADDMYRAHNVAQAERVLLLARALWEDYSELHGEPSGHQMLLGLYAMSGSPADGVRYLQENGYGWEQYHAFAYLYGWKRPEEAFHVFERAIELFPNEPQLYKGYALLASGGPRRFSLAISVCERAIARGVQDGTKTGFVGRLARIQAKQLRLEGLE